MTNYSYGTSLPAYHDKTHKEFQRKMILGLLVRLGGRSFIKELALETGLPDSTIAGRVNDLIKEGSVYYGATEKWKDRRRKQILLVANDKSMPAMRTNYYGFNEQQGDLFPDKPHTYDV